MSSASTPYGGNSPTSTSTAYSTIYLPPVDLSVDGCLFDLDGTLMLSTECVEMFWHDFGVKHNIDSHKLLETSHGRRTIDILKIWKPEMADPVTSGELEATIPVRWASFATPVPGVRELHDALPADRWGIVTSGTLPMASGWLKHFLKFQPPKVFITAEDVVEGKPDPTGYKLGAERLGLKDFLVFEDAPAGIKAGKDAGATVIGMATTYTPDIVKAAGADIVVRDLHSVQVKGIDEKTGKLNLTFTNIVA